MAGTTRELHVVPQIRTPKAPWPVNALQIHGRSKYQMMQEATTADADNVATGTTAGAPAGAGASVVMRAIQPGSFDEYHNP